MVRKGSPVRVRQRALEKAPLRRGFSLSGGAPVRRDLLRGPHLGHIRFVSGRSGVLRNGSLGWARGERGEDRGDLADVVDRPVGHRDDELVGGIIVGVEHDPRADAHAGPKASCEVTGSKAVHVSIVGRPEQVCNPPKEAGAAQKPSKCKPPAVGFRIQRLRTSAASPTTPETTRAGRPSRRS